MIYTLYNVISEVDMDYVSVMAVMLTYAIYAQSETRPEYRLLWLRFGMTFLSHSKQM